MNAYQLVYLLAVTALLNVVAITAWLTDDFGGQARLLFAFIKGVATVANLAVVIGGLASGLRSLGTLS